MPASQIQVDVSQKMERLEEIAQLFTGKSQDSRVINKHFH